MSDRNPSSLFRSARATPIGLEIGVAAGSAILQIFPEC
jgi:hypothetical protein